MARAFLGSSSQFIEYAGAVVNAVPITLAAWVRCRDVDTSQDVIFVGDNTSSNNQFRLNLGGATAGDPVRAVTTNSGGTVSLAVSSTGYSNNVWCHACAVFAANNDRRAFINGGSKGTNTTAGTPTAGSINRTAIGRASPLTPSAYLTGDIAEAAIWSAALTDTEVAALASGVLPWRIRPAALLAYLPLWGQHSPEIDLKTPATSWVVTGATLANHAPVQPFSARYWGSTPLIEVAAAGGVPRHYMYYQRLRAA